MLGVLLPIETLPLRLIDHLGDLRGGQRWPVQRVAIHWRDSAVIDAAPDGEVGGRSGAEGSIHRQRHTVIDTRADVASPKSPVIPGVMESHVTRESPDEPRNTFTAKSTA